MLSESYYFLKLEAADLEGAFKIGFPAPTIVTLSEMFIALSDVLVKNQVKKIAMLFI